MPKPSSTARVIGFVPQNDVSFEIAVVAISCAAVVGRPAASADTAPADTATSATTIAAVRRERGGVRCLLIMLNLPDPG